MRLLRFNTKLTNDCWLVVNTGNSKRDHSSALSQMIMSWHRVPIWQGHVACSGPSEPWGQGGLPPYFGRSVNLLLIREGHTITYAHHITTRSPPQDFQTFLRPCAYLFLFEAVLQTSRTRTETRLPTAAS